ncbi:MAG: HEPN domain-containing protein [Ignavibacteriales bacterium]|nr:MAG: HEPN domain-containing protein [Ignavibacteriales bacterium]
MREIDSLLKRADRFLISSQMLIKDGDFESSVSRSYYAMFFCAQALLLSKGLSYSSHKMTILAFGENFVKTEIFSKDMGKDFNKAFDRRQLSDYNFEFIISKEEAEELLDSAKYFIQTISDYLRMKN